MLGSTGQCSARFVRKPDSLGIMSTRQGGDDRYFRPSSVCSVAGNLMIRLSQVCPQASPGVSNLAIAGPTFRHRRWCGISFILTLWFLHT